MQLRPAVASDAAVMVELYGAAWRANLAHLFSEGALEAWDLSDRLATVEGWFAADSGVESVVAEADGTLLGYATVRDDQLLNLFVDPAGQGTGAGGALLEEAEQLLLDAGHQEIRLFTLVGNDAAVAFYTRRGWEQTDVREPGEYFGEPQVRQMLIKQLEAGSS